MRRLILLILSGVLLAACSSIECPMNSRVYTTYKLQGTVKKLQDSLTVFANLGNGVDSIVLNRAIEVDSFLLPMSYANDADTFYFLYANKSGKLGRDTIVVEKTNQPHFESVDCNAVVFHTIKSVRFTTHMIENLSINNANVNYDATPSHFNITFKDRYQ